MKRIISTLLVTAFVLSTLAFGVIGAGAVGAEKATDKEPEAFGTVASNYAPATGATEIKSAEEFKNMTANGNYYLSADITLDATYTTEFKGTLDGCGHTVTISQPMFVRANGSIKNLIIKGTISKDVPDSDAAVGALTNLVSAKVTYENIANYANITNTSTAPAAEGDESVAGGIVGKAGGSVAIVIKDCYNHGNVSGPEAVGGILGKAQVKNDMLSIQNCLNDGKVTNTATAFDIKCAGGILGYNGTSSVSISGCVNKGEVTSKFHAAGIHADTRKGTNISDCVNYGKITNETSGTAGAAGAAGGIVGFGLDASCTNNMDISKCENYGEVASNGGCAGGMFGFGGRSLTSGNGYKYKVTDCINYGKISGKYYVGGLGGYAYGSGKQNLEAENFINFGDVHAEGSTSFASNFMAYSNSVNTTLKNVVGAGKISTDEGGHTAIFGLSSADAKQYKITNLFIFGDTTNYYSYGSYNEDTTVGGKNYSKNQFEISAVPEALAAQVNVSKTVTDEAVAKINEIFGSTVLYNDGGKLTTEKPVPPAEEPTTPSTGDATVAYIVLACVCATVALGLAVVPKKKRTF